MRILIVDDTPDIRLLLRIQVERFEGVTDVHEATNGLEAIESTRRLHPDLIILDLDMPLMSGDAALPFLRELVPEAVIVVYSATAFVEGPHEAPRANAYLQKGRDEVGDYVARVLATSGR